MVTKYEKLNSRYNVYPFKTCPICGLTYAIMGENPPRISREERIKRTLKIPKVDQMQIPDLMDTEEESSSLMIDIDSLEEYVYDELIDETNEFLLAEMLNTTDCKIKYYNEKFEHSLYCARFKAARKKYGTHHLTYQERNYIIKNLLPLLNEDQDISTKELLIRHLCEIFFSESLEMLDFSLSHPKFPEFVNLLWSTPWFLEEVKKYLTDEEISKLKNKYPQNDGLRGNRRWWTFDKAMSENYENIEEDSFKFLNSEQGNFLEDDDVGDFFDEQ